MSFINTLRNSLSSMLAVKAVDTPATRKADQAEDRKTNQRRNAIIQSKINQHTGSKDKIPGTISSDDVVDFSWQTQAAIINAGIFQSLTAIANALRRDSAIDVDLAAEAVRAWNYSAGVISTSGQFIPSMDDERLLTTIAKVFAYKPQAALPDSVLAVMARRAKVPVEQYIQDVRDADAGKEAEAASLMQQIEELVVGHHDALGCSEATISASLAVDKIDRQMDWMCRTWKDKTLVAAELPLMESDIAIITALAAQGAGAKEKFVEGTLCSDGLAVAEVSRGTDRELDSSKAPNYEPDALQAAFAEAEQEIVQKEIVSNRRRIRQAA